MLNSTREFINYLDAEGIRYTLDGTTESGKDRMYIQYSGDNMSAIRMLFLFDTDGESVGIRVFDIVKVPQEKLGAVILTICDLNYRFRFVKFCFDHDDNTVQAEIDAAFRPGSIGEVCAELMYHCVSICDKAYPELMKSLWQ